MPRSSSNRRYSPRTPPVDLEHLQESLDESSLESPSVQESPPASSLSTSSRSSYSSSPTFPLAELSLDRNATYRPVDWRWRLVQKKLALSKESGSVSSSALQRTINTLFRNARKDDPIIQKLFAFAKEVRLLDQSRNYDRILYLRSKHSDLFQAWEVEHHENPLVRYELQARLLANEPYERIASRLCIPTSVISTYEKCFFNVSDRLENRGYIAHCVFGRLLQIGMKEKDLDILWKVFGYFGGPYVLDAVIDRTLHTMRPNAPAEVGAYVASDVYNTMMIKGLIAARTLPINVMTQHSILDIYQRFIEIRKEAEEAGSDAAVLAVTIQKVMEDIPWGVGDYKRMVSGKDPDFVVCDVSTSKRSSLDSHSREMRANELLRLEAGQFIDESEITSKTFPDAGKTYEAIDPDKVLQDVISKNKSQ